MLPDDVDRASPVISDASLIVLQLEISVDTVAAAAFRAGPSTTVVLNAAPASVVPGPVLQRVDVLVVNEREAALLLGQDHIDAAGAARSLLRAGPAAVVVTTGASGATVASAGETWLEPAPPARVVDTTGAGDVLVGVLAAELSRRSTRRPDVWVLRHAVSSAVRAASESVSQVGARKPTGG